MKRHIFHYEISEVAPYIDWSYLLHAWGLTGKATEHTAEEIINDAKAILDETEGKYRTHALFALCEAKGSDDDIIIEERKFPLLRQQHTQTDKPNLCLSDFVSPHGDKIGLFATTIDGTFGTGHSDDPYHHLLAQTLADRLAEATASLMHRQIRTQKELWGYSQHEELTIKELLQEKNQGIRPAVGYPSLPDQSIIFEIDKIVNLGEIGITLTPNGAMTPHASVCGMIFAHPQARYFAVGRISDEQLADYAQRRGTTPPELKKYLSRNIE
jgi:cobalamin-dependent methionine synthase I